MSLHIYRYINMEIRRYGSEITHIDIYMELEDNNECTAIHRVQTWLGEFADIYMQKRHLEYISTHTDIRMYGREGRITIDKHTCV